MEIEITGGGSGLAGILTWLCFVVFLLALVFAPQNKEVDLKPKSKKNRPYNPFFMDEE